MAIARRPVPCPFTREGCESNCVAIARGSGERAHWCQRYVATWNRYKRIELAVPPRVQLAADALPPFKTHRPARKTP